MSRADVTRAPPFCPGGSRITDDPALANGYFVSPRPSSTGVGEEMRIAREEIFGPVVTAVPFDDLEEVACARETRLSTDSRRGSGQATSARQQRSLASLIEAGTVWVNTLRRPRPVAVRAIRRLQDERVRTGSSGWSNSTTIST